MYVPLDPRIRRATSNPSMPGRDTSSVVTSGSWARTARTPSSPFPVLIVEKPACPSTCSSRYRMSRSSSITTATRRSCVESSTMLSPSPATVVDRDGHADHPRRAARSPAVRVARLSAVLQHRAPRGHLGFRARALPTTAGRAAHRCAHRSRSRRRRIGRPGEQDARCPRRLRRVDCGCLRAPGGRRRGRDRVGRRPGHRVGRVRQTARSVSRSLHPGPCTAGPGLPSER